MSRIPFFLGSLFSRILEKRENHGGNIDRVLEETRERLKKNFLQHGL